MQIGTPLAIVMLSASLLAGCGNETEQEKLAREINRQTEELKAKKAAEKPLTREEWERRMSKSDPFK